VVSADFSQICWPKLEQMNAPPLQFLMLIFAGWVNRHQQDVIEYLQEETGPSAPSSAESDFGLPISSVDGSPRRPSKSAEEGSLR
jgi:hypothetical protein